MARLKQIIFGGLKVVLPLTFILFVLYWLIGSTENLFGSVLKALFGEKFYFYGSGLLLAFGIILLMGLLLQTKTAKIIYSHVDQTIKQLPIINSLYRMSSNMISFLAKERDQQAQHVVLVKTPLGKMMGVITSDQPDIGSDTSNMVVVYIPMSYQIGGYSILIPRQNLEFLTIGVEEAFQVAMTAWMAGDKGAKS